jgi:methyl-accepting chemotaxis protein
MNTARPASYINLQAAETSGLHIKFFQAVPNYFVGIGLLFTFLGLVAAIFFASEGIKAGAGIAETQDSLRNLLNAATFKFLTSIAGIMSSLLVAISYRLVAGNLQKHFDNLCEALEERLLFATAESIAIQQLREVRNQTIQLERFNTDLAFSIATELDKKLNTSLSAALSGAIAPLESTMADMADRFGEMNQDAMTSMVENFTENLNQSAGAELTALAQSLAETKESLSGLVGTLQSAGGNLNSTLDAAGSRLQNAAASMEESLKHGMNESANQLQTKMGHISQQFHDQFTQSSAKFSAALAGVSSRADKIMEPMQEHLDKLASRLDGLSNGLGEQITSIGQLNGQLGTLVKNTEAASLRLQNAGEPVQRASQAIGSAADKIAQMGVSTIQTQENLAVLAESVKGSVDETTAHWADYAKRFEQVDKDLANTFKELRDGTSQQVNVIREFVSGVDREFAKALKNLGAGVENLEENLEEFTSVVESLNKTFGRAGRTQ